MTLRWSSAIPGCVLLALALAWCALSVMGAPAEPMGATEVTYRLQAESLAHEADLVYAESDRLRFLERDWTDRRAKVEVMLEGESLRYQRAFPYAVALAPFVRLAPETGPYLLNLLLLLALVLLVLARLARESPNSAPYWSLALVFGTPVFAYSRAVWPELFVAVLLAVAYVLIGQGRRAEELPQMAAARPRVWTEPVRWGAAGALTAFVVLQDPLYALFLPALLFPAFRGRREAAWGSAIAAFSLVLLVTWFAGGAALPAVSPWSVDFGLEVRAADPIDDVAEWTRRLATLEPSGFAFDPQLWSWSALYALVGRHVGIVATFLPLLALVLSGRSRRRLIWAAAAGFAVLTLLFEPFNFFGGPEALGNRRLLPALVLCFFAVRPSRSVWPAILACGLGAAAIAPLWLEPQAHPMVARSRVLSQPVASRLPFETSQRYAPVSGESVSRDLLVRPANAAVEPGSGQAQFVLLGGGKGELMVASTYPLEHLDFEFGAGAGSDLDVTGGEVEDLLFRPDGGVTFRVRVDDSSIRHRLWRRNEVHEVHMMKLAMPGESRASQPFSITLPRIGP